MVPATDETCRPKTKPLIPSITNVSIRHLFETRERSVTGVKAHILLSSKQCQPGKTSARALGSGLLSFAYMVSANRQNGLPQPIRDKVLHAEPPTRAVGVRDTHACAVGSSDTNDYVCIVPSCDVPTLNITTKCNQREIPLITNDTYSSMLASMLGTHSVTGSGFRASNPY